jgi:hypothetical protein
LCAIAPVVFFHQNENLNVKKQGFKTTTLLFLDHYVEGFFGELPLGFVQQISL